MFFSGMPDRHQLPTGWNQGVRLLMQEVAATISPRSRINRSKMRWRHASASASSICVENTHYVRGLGAI
jgi:hypothetical protein